MIHIAKFIARHLVLTAFLAVVAGAVLLTLARVLTPIVLARYTDDIAAYASEKLGQPVTITRLDARWQGLGPALVLKDVSLLSPDDRRPVLSLEEIAVDFGLADMLRTGFIAPGRITVSGSQLTVVRRSDGSLDIQGIEVAPQSTDADASALLLIPARVELRESQVVWLDQMRGRPPLVIGDVDLRIRNDETRHQVDAGFRIGDRPFTLHADLHSTGGRLAEWAGEIYFRAERIFLPQLLGTQLPTYYSIDNGEANLELWGDWSGGQLRTLSGHGSISGLRLRGGEQERPLDLDELGGRFLWRRTPDGWRLDIGDMVTRRAGRQWPTNHVFIEVRDPGTTTETYRLKADYLNLSDLIATLAVRPPAGTLVSEFLASNPSGEVRNLEIDISPRGGRLFSVTADLKDVSMAAEGRLPLFQNLSARVHATTNGGRVQLDTRDALIYPTGMFRWPIPLEQLAGEVRWQRLNDGWRIETDHLEASNEHIHTLTRLRLDLPPDGSPFMDLQTDFRDGVGTDIPLYLPVGIMPPTVVEWLDRSIVDGRVPAGSAIVRGPLRDFPFHETHTGHFEVSFGVEEAYLDYREDWPPLEHALADVRFHNNRLEISHGEAYLYENRLSDVVVTIESLRPISPLTIRGQATGPLGDMLRFLRETPLHERYRYVVDDTVAEGNGDLALELAIPLSPDDEFALSGTLSTENAQLTNPGIALFLTDAAGSLKLSHKGISADGLAGRYADTPVTVNIDSPRGNARIRAEGTFHTDALKRQFTILDGVPLDGRSPWTVTVTLPEVDQLARKPVHVRAASQLAGTRVDLPLGLGKSSEPERPFAVDFEIGRQALGTLDLTYGDLVVQAKPNQAGWEAMVSGPTISGTLFIPRPGDTRPLRADLERIAVDIEPGMLSSVAEDGTASPRPDDIPAAELSARQVLINGHDYGALTARTQRIENGVRLDTFQLQSADGQLGLNGEWTAVDGSQQVALEVRVETSDAGRTLSDLQLSQTLVGGECEIDAAIQWQGGPLDLQRETLAGTLHLRIEQGRLQETDPGFGRLFALLNLTALQRRLRLDFTDLFKEGLVFDEIEGNFTLDGGVAHTGDTTVKSSAAEIEIKGNANLASMQLDQEVSVTPAISGTMAVVGAMAVNPALGVALLAAGKNLDRLATARYRMTGPWDEPQIERIDTREDASTPEQETGIPEIH